MVSLNEKMMNLHKSILLLGLLGFGGCVTEDIDSADLPISQEALTRSTAETYYWVSDRKVYLKQIPDKYYVLFRKDALDTTDAALTRSGISLDIAGVRGYSLEANVVTEAETVFDGCVWTTAKGRNPIDFSQVLYAAPYYTTKDGTELGLSNGFRIELKKAEDLGLLKTFAAENDAAIVRHSSSMPLWYSLVCLPGSTLNALELSNKAYESGMFAGTAVDFIGGIFLCASYNDPGYADQWNLYNRTNPGFDLRFDGVHGITKGDPSIVVAVVDGGMQLNHPDLKIDRSWDAVEERSPAKIYMYPDNPQQNHHGTEVCSIIGATPNNGRGIVGIAPDATLLAVSAKFGEWNSREYLAKGIKYAASNGADVINCSWVMSEGDTQLNQAFENALTDGRNGQGCVVVCCSGNSVISDGYYPNTEFPEILTVGGMTSQGHPDSGTTKGASLDVIAPSPMIPVLQLEGKSSVDNGTSLAAPQVAAVAALILSKNPDLSGKAVCDIIERTAWKLPTYEYGTEDGRPNGLRNPKSGYGAVDAYSALSYGAPAESIENKIIDNHIEKTGWFVFMENVAVDPGGSLTLNTMNGVHIRAPFVVAQGGELRLTVK